VRDKKLNPPCDIERLGAATTYRGANTLRELDQSHGPSPTN